MDAHPNELEELKDADDGEAKEETNGTTHIGQDAAKCVLGKVLDNHCGPGVIIDLDPQKAKMKVSSYHLFLPTSVHFLPPLHQVLDILPHFIVRLISNTAQGIFGECCILKCN